MADVSGNATSLLQLLVTEINTGTNGSRALMSITTEYISPMIPRPAHYDEQVEALTAILGLIMLGLIAALAIRIYKSPSGSWLFRFVDGRERYLVPHGTISWASVLLLECMALEVYLCYHDTGASNISLTTAATSVSVAFAWTALNVIAIARLITLTKAAKVPSASSHPSGSAVGISEPYTSSTGAPAVPRNRELRNALWTLMALSAAMSLSTVAFCGTILQGLISGDVEQVSSRLILTLA
ncbi:hypothetical protein MNV49_003434 [Pseudohyphozyma bogoriensis]|nr:hypothetical protein MNV49_003434 [Pseudohyphozyma bogoriensis]